MLQRD
ncbi:hypothetical protein LINPERHAP2_LOCUS3759 [Linum perenne]